MQEQISTSRHLILAQVRNDQFLAMELMSPLHTSRKHRMTFGCVAADNNHESRVFNVLERAGVATNSNSPEQTLCCRSLAVAGTIVHVVGANDSARQLLHQVALLIGAFRRGDKRQ